MPLQGQTQANIDSATGFGRFDLQITPATNQLEVTVKVFFNVNGGIDKNAFLAAWRQKVSDGWDNQFEFRSAAGNLRAVFDIQEAGNLASCHFPVRLSPGFAAGSGLKLPDAGGNPFPGHWFLDLHDQDNTPYSVAQNLANGLGVNEVNAGRARVVLAEHDRVMEALNACGNIELTRAGDDWAIEHNSQNRLRAFAAEVKRCPSFMPQNPLTVEATSGIREKANTLVGVVYDFLEAERVQAQLTRSVVKTKRKWKRPFAPHKTRATVVIRVEGFDQILRSWRDHVEADYMVSAHEFGHLLGLPDEYLSYQAFNNDTIRGSQPAWDNLCDNARLATGGAVPRRAWNGQFNDSMMSIGTVLYPCHAVTIGRALDDMTQRAPNSLPADSWTIKVV